MHFSFFNIFFLILFLVYLSDAENILNFKKIYLEIGSNIGSHVKERIFNHFNKIQSVSVLSYEENQIKNFVNYFDFSEEKTLILSLGNASLSRKKISESDLFSIPDEGFYYRLFKEQNNLYILASNGLSLSQERHKNLSFNPLDISYGAITGAYFCLELLGFRFLHPLDPYIPSDIRITHDKIRNRDDHNSIVLEGAEFPHWPERAFHIHTQHPLELTEVLQGHDIPQFGPHGPWCRKKFNDQYSENFHTDNGDNSPYCERWEDMVMNVDNLFEWAIANRLNKIEWLLLGNYKWGDEFETRLKRLRLLTDLGHMYSLMVGADIPIGNIQQHGWYIVNVRLPLSQQIKQIKERVDVIFNAGFDSFTTESGLSEFTHPECDLMLDLMNALATYVNETWGRETGVKVHCSTGQTCEKYLDPRTGEPINFNFLPTFAHPGMSVFPHTVQVYGLDDPTAFTYGNENFSYVEDYMVYEAKKANRSVLFYGETAYWVNVDIDVPLFLPIYGQRRQHDLRRIAVREVREEFRIQGQLNFDSGWEWGYWLSDVVTARSSWDPQLPRNDKGTIDNDLINQATYSPNTNEWEIFSKSIEIFTSIYGSIYGQKLNNLLIRLSQAQMKSLVFGEVSGKKSPNLRKLSGLAYMSGSDTWVDVPRLFGLAFTQPDKIHLRESHDPDWSNALNLLESMKNIFGNFSDEMDELYNDIRYHFDNGKYPEFYKNNFSRAVLNDYLKVNTQGLILVDEIRDCIKLLSLRSHQLYYLYNSKDPIVGRNHETKSLLQRKSRQIIKDALDIVRHREKYYRVPWERIASWRENPTVYRFGYLWAVHSLFYWWRDQGLAEQGSLQSEISPCYLNRMDASEVAVGWGKYTMELFRSLVNRYSPFSEGFPIELINCLSPPSHEYEFPRHLYHFD